MLSFNAVYGLLGEQGLVEEKLEVAVDCRSDRIFGEITVEGLEDMEHVCAIYFLF